jgi:hypothetical protein
LEWAESHRIQASGNIKGKNNAIYGSGIGCVLSRLHGDMPPVADNANGFWMLWPRCIITSIIYISSFFKKQQREGSNDRYLSL